MSEDTNRQLKTIKQLNNVFSKLPESQLDIRLCISNGAEGQEVDYVAEGTDEWGNKHHIVSGITDTSTSALAIITEILVLRRIKNE